MDSKEVRSIMKQVRDNAEKIRNCQQHVFGDVLGAPGEGLAAFNARRTCMDCGGTMKDSDIVHYARGYKAAGGDPDDIAMFHDGGSIS